MLPHESIDEGTRPLYIVRRLLFPAHLFRAPLQPSPTGWRRNLYGTATFRAPPCVLCTGWHRILYCIAALLAPVCTYNTDWRRNLYCTTALPVPLYNYSEGSKSRMQHSMVTPSNSGNNLCSHTTVDSTSAMYNAIPTTTPNAPTRGENILPATLPTTAGTNPIPRSTARAATRTGLQAATGATRLPTANNPGATLHNNLSPLPLSLIHI